MWRIFSIFLASERRKKKIIIYLNCTYCFAGLPATLNSQLFLIKAKITVGSSIYIYDYIPPKSKFFSISYLENSISKLILGVMKLLWKHMGTRGWQLVPPFACSGFVSLSAFVFIYIFIGKNGWIDWLVCLFTLNQSSWNLFPFCVVKSRRKFVFKNF